MKNNHKRVFISILLVLLIILICLIVIAFVYQKKEDTHSKVMGVPKDPEIEEKIGKLISYDNISILQKLDGDTPISTVVGKVKKTVIESIPSVIKETDNMSNKELTNYFHNNESKIWKDLSINNENSFLNMINNVRNLKADLMEDCESCKFIEKDDGISFVVYYSNGETVECSIKGDNADYVAFEF